MGRRNTSGGTFGTVLSDHKGKPYSAVKIFKNVEGRVRAVLTNNIDRFITFDADDPAAVMQQARTWAAGHNAALVEYREVFNEAWDGVERYYL